ncbi:MAG: hypothetical protein AAGC46_15075 [Solirubrobacteraceae bacterium]|nr:hypothetical protein [Patulibacter sp.]
MHPRFLAKLLLPGVVVAALAGASPAHASDPDPTDQWARWGASPQDAWVRSLDFIGPLLFAGAEGEGVFSSPTALGPWQQDNGGLTTQGAKTVHQVKVAPDGQVYAATSDGLFRSQGGLGGWSQVGGGTGLHKLNMGGVQSIMFNGPTGLDMTVAVAGAGGPGVYTSSDGGSTWDKASGMPDGENVYSLASGPLTVPLYAAADDGVFQSPDLGRHWVLTSDGIPPGETTLRVAVSPTNPANLYASTSSNVYTSNTAGVKWSAAAGKDGATLPAGGKRAFLLLPALNGKFGENHAVVGTDQGVWGTLDGGDHWGQMSPSTFAPSSGTPMKDRVVWALNLGFTTPVLMAGTQGFGVFNVPIQPITGGAPTVAPTTGLKPGTELKISNDDAANQKFMGFNGTRPYFFTYQWLRCATINCTPTVPISGAVASTYTVPDDDAGTDARYAVRITARNLVSPNPLTVTSGATAAAGVDPLPGAAPRPKAGLDLTQSPGGQPYIGTTLTIVPGTWRTEASAAQITPSAFRYLWERCGSIACSTITGATGISYKTTPSDIGYAIRASVSATGPAPAKVPSDFFLADSSSTVLNAFPVNTTLPKIVGNAYTGETLSSAAGGWTGYAMTYTRRWFRCDEDGLGCNPINFPSQTGSTYTVTQADLGSRLQLEVTASAADPNQNRLTVAFSAQTAVITVPPPAPVDPGTPGAGAPGVVTPGGAAPGAGAPGGQQITPVVPVQKAFTVPVSLPKKLKVGSTLTLPKSVSGYRKATYQWMRNGKKIKKATKRTYKLTKADRGKAISCHLTLTPAGGGAKVVVDTAPVVVPKS